MKTIDKEVRKCNLLKDELHVCKRAIKNLYSKIRNLELEAVRQQTCRVSVFDNRPLKSGGRMVVQMRRSSGICAIVNLTSEDPCPTPVETLMKAAYNNVIDPARTMCDIWSTWHKHELNEKRRQLRQAKRRDTYTKATVTQAFGGCAVSEDAPVFSDL
jgi:hypothetical protein